uniref:C2H2-type domain-containing protein n=1 Tax=Euplotes crassus TaxID=5936 RepID=A0A7S3NQJ9_EUPCR|mmetsp:Transcript_21743/g.21457  ORF Transcript_21743/g.21457 Transcript_21743/m.21457 type:complete len:127 (+) Transcript_21743:184-564(+)
MFWLPEKIHTFPNDMKHEIENSIPLLDPELANCNLDLQSMTKEDIYFELLKGYQYQTLYHFDTKKQREVPLYKCGEPGCDKVMQKPWNLLDHVRMHAGVKPYMCKWCGNRFTQKGNLKKHKLTHRR